MICVPEDAAPDFVSAPPGIEDSGEVPGDPADDVAAVDPDAETCAEDALVGGVAVPIDEADELPVTVLAAVADPGADELHPAISNAVATAKTANPEHKAREALSINCSRRDGRHCCHERLPFMKSASGEANSRRVPQNVAWPTVLAVPPRPASSQGRRRNSTRATDIGHYDYRSAR